MADGDLSFLMPGREPRSEEAARLLLPLLLLIEFTIIRRRLSTVNSASNPTRFPTSLRIHWSQQVPLILSMPFPCRHTKCRRSRSSYPKGNPPALTPKKPQATQTRASTSAGLSGRQPMSRTVDNRPRLGGKPISRKIPIEDAMLTSDVMAVLTGRRVQSVERLPSELPNHQSKKSRSHKAQRHSDRDRLRSCHR